MAMLDSDYFVYDGINSNDMGIVNIVYDQQDLFQENFTASRTIQEIQVNHRKRPYFQRIVDAPITLTLQFAFSDEWDSDSIRSVARWLIQPYYKPLWFSDNPDKIYYAMQSGDTNLNHDGVKRGYINIQFRCDSPYTYSPQYATPVYDLSTNPSGGTVIQINNQGDLNCAPEMWITKVGNTGDITITNQSDGTQPIFTFQGSNYATGQYVFYGIVTDQSTISIGNEVYTIVADGTSQVFNDSMTSSGSWSSVAGTGSFGSTGWTSTAKGSLVKAGTGWKPTTSSGGASEPVTVQATFIVPANPTAGNTQYELRLYLDQDDFYSLYATDTTLYIGKLVESSSGGGVVTASLNTLSSVTQSISASTTYTATLSIDSSGNLTGNLYSGSSSLGTPIQTLTAVDSTPYTNFGNGYLIAVGGDLDTVVTSATVTAPITLSGFEIDCTSAQDANTAATAFANTVNSKSQIVTATSNGSAVTVTAKTIGVIGQYPLETTVPSGAWTNLSMDGGDGLVDGEVVYIDNENMDIESSLQSSGIYRYDAFNDNYLSLGIGVNNLLVQGNCKIQFRYEFKTLQG